MSLKDEIVSYVLKTPENSNPNVLRSIIDNSSGGDSSSVLIVNATPDMEHAESGNITPLILDKTIDEMLAAECTVLVIDAGSGTYYVLHEVSREVNYGLGWFAMLDGTPMYAEASNDGAEHIIGDTFATVDALTVAAAPFVLHGTRSADDDYNGGTIAESAEELRQAISNGKRIILAVSSSTATPQRFNVRYDVSSTHSWPPGEDENLVSCGGMCCEDGSFWCFTIDNFGADPTALKFMFIFNA